LEASPIGSFNVKRVLKLIPVLNTTTTTLPTTPSGCTCHYFAAAKSLWWNFEMETLHRAVICHKQPEGNIFRRRRCIVTAHHCQLQIGIAGRSARSQSKKERLVPHMMQLNPLGLGSSGRLYGSHFGVLLRPHNGTYKKASCNTSRKSNNCISATARPMDVDVDGGSSVGTDANNLVEAGVSWFDAFYRFSRPHTIIGSALGVISVSMLAIQSPADFSSTFFVGLLQALIPALLMNVYIVGLNQIYDIDIDKVNKPYLPLASGEYSLNTGITLVTVCAALSLAIGLVVGSRPLLWALTVSLVLGTAYSADVPFLRWKRSAVAAATCILAVRAVVVQLGFYLHMQASVFKRAAVLTRPLWFAMGFMCFFSIVIALAKDIPDVEGDKVFGIRSFSVRMGQKKGDSERRCCLFAVV